MHVRTGLEANRVGLAMTMDNIGSPEWDLVTNRLVAQKQLQTGVGFCEFEMPPIAGTGGFQDNAMNALGFCDEDFGMRDRQAVSCTICGGLFIDRLWVMRRHRLACGWN